MEPQSHSLHLLIGYAQETILRSIGQNTYIEASVLLNDHDLPSYLQFVCILESAEFFHFKQTC